MADSLKLRIIELRKQGKSYDEIVDLLKCSKGVISYHCKKHGMEDVGLGHSRFDRKLIDALNLYYLQHTKLETANHFKIAPSTVLKYVSKKREFRTVEDKKLRNYQRVKMVRIRMKEKSVAYKGGKCERCGYDKCIWALSFHHRDVSEKEFSLSQYRVMDWGRIKRELDKCELVCENCHREIHYEIEMKQASVREYKPCVNLKREKIKSEKGGIDARKTGKTMLLLKCPNCDKEFIREKRQCHLANRNSS